MLESGVIENTTMDALEVGAGEWGKAQTTLHHMQLTIVLYYTVLHLELIIKF